MVSKTFDRAPRRRPWTFLFSGPQINTTSPSLASNRLQIVSSERPVYNGSWTSTDRCRPALKPCENPGFGAVIVAKYLFFFWGCVRLSGK